MQYERSHLQKKPVSETPLSSAVKHPHEASVEHMTSTANQVLQLQQTRGNRYVVSMLARTAIESKADVQRKKHKHTEELDPVSVFFGGNSGPAIEHREEAVPAGSTPTPLNAALKPSTLTETATVAPTTVIAGDATFDAIQQRLNVLQRLRPKSKLRTVIEGEVGSSNSLELTDEDQNTLVKGIVEVRALIGAMTPKSTGMTAEQISKKQGDYNETLADIAPYRYQMGNKDILFGLSTEGKSGQWVYNHAAGRTCNVTALSMSLEGLGISQADFQGDTTLLQAILEAQQSEAEQVKWATNRKERGASTMSAKMGSASYSRTGNVP